MPLILDLASLLQHSPGYQAWSRWLLSTAGLISPLVASLDALGGEVANLVPGVDGGVAVRGFQPREPLWYCTIMRHSPSQRPHRNSQDWPTYTPTRTSPVPPGSRKATVTAAVEKCVIRTAPADGIDCRTQPRSCASAVIPVRSAALGSLPRTRPACYGHDDQCIHALYGYT